MISNALMDTQGNGIVPPLKRNEYYQVPLFKMYRYTTKYSHLSGEELKEYFCSAFIPYIHTLPKVSSIFKYKGNLRISWAFDIKYNKNIDLIFFPEENPYINYAVLFAKDFPKKIDEEEIGRCLKEITITSNINYDFVKEILSQSDFSKAQQERFFQVRFGSIFIPMEIEFEWYSVYWYYQGVFSKSTSIEKTILFPKYDKYLNGILEGGESLNLCLGIIKSYQVLPINTPLNFPPFITSWEENEFNEKTQLNEDVTKYLSYSDIFTPLPTAALATTQTNIGDYIVNLRDKPHSKEGKIVAQLLSQSFSYDLLQPKFKKLQQANGWGDETTWTFMDEEMQKHYQAKQAYFKKEKQKLINPLENYLILVWNIEPNDWAKVWVLKMIRENDTAIFDGVKAIKNSKNITEFHPIKKERFFKEYKQELEEQELGIDRYSDTFHQFLNGSYKQTFLESPSTLKLYEGYIHTSGLKYLTPFSENYIKR